MKSFPPTWKCVPELDAASPTDGALPDRRRSPWLFWLGVACLVAVAIPYIDRALSEWREDHRLRTTVLHFFNAVAQGRKDAALNCLAPEYRTAVEAGWDPAFNQHWQPTEDVAFQVLAVEREAATAQVRMAIVKSTFSLKPIVHLRRVREDAWQITRIEGVTVDPRWIRWSEREARETQQRLADELAEKLQAPAPDHADSP
jgi:hypothetical protein